MPKVSSKKNDSSVDFGDRLRDLRLKHKISQSELAQKVGVHTSHIGRYERGASKPHAKHLKALAQAFAVSTDYLLDGKPQDAAYASLEDREMLAFFQEAEKLNDEEKGVVKRLLGAFLRDARLKKEYETG